MMGRIEVMYSTFVKGAWGLGIGWSNGAVTIDVLKWSFIIGIDKGRED